MRILATLGVLIFFGLSGCGFALRGVSSPLPERFAKTYLQDVMVPNNRFQRRIEQLIVLGGGHSVERDVANVKISVSDITTYSRQIALSGNGAAKEYERTFSTTVTITDLTTGIQLGSRQLSTTRNIQLDDRNVLAGEEQSEVTQSAAEHALANAVYQYLKTF